MATPEATAIATSASEAKPSRDAAPWFDLRAFHATPLQREPFDYLIVPGFVRPDALEALNRDYPEIDGPGNVSADNLRCGPSFEALLTALRSDAFAALFATKFGVDPTGCPSTITVRRYCEATDGNIHTDHRSKLITILLYFNQSWPHEGGKLRLLRSANDLEDHAAEVTPAGGTLLAFRRSDRSFHGHKPFVGERRILQLSWTRGGDMARYVSSLTKPVRRILNMS